MQTLLLRKFMMSLVHEGPDFSAVWAADALHSPMRRGLKEQEALARLQPLIRCTPFPDEEGTERLETVHRSDEKSGCTPFPDEEGTERRSMCRWYNNAGGCTPFPEEEGTERTPTRRCTDLWSRMHSIPR